MKTIQDYAKQCDEGSGACPAWRDGGYPQMCACYQRFEIEPNRKLKRLAKLGLFCCLVVLSMWICGAYNMLMVIISSAAIWLALFILLCAWVGFVLTIFSIIDGVRKLLGLKPVTR